MICIALGLVISAAMQRYLIGGVGCFGAFFFFAWLALLVCCFLPLIILGSVRSWADPDEAKQDCEKYFGNGKDDFADTTCIIRNWSLLIGLIVIGVVLLIISLIGFREAATSLFAERHSANVRERTGMRGIVHRFWDNRRVRAGYDPGIEDLHVLGGYRSQDEDFYNFSEKIDGHSAAQKLLYAPRVQWDLSAVTTGKTGGGRQR